MLVRRCKGWLSLTLLLAAIVFMGGSVLSSSGELEILPFEALRGPGLRIMGDLECEISISVPEDVHQSSAEARIQLLAGDFAAVADTLEAEELSGPGSEQMMYYLALAHIGMRSTAGAERSISAVDEGVYRGLIHFALGYAYLNLAGLFESADFERAESHLASAVVSLESAVSPRIAKAILHIEKGEADLAVDILSGIVEICQESAAVYVLLGDALSATGDTISSIYAYEKAYELGDESSVLMGKLADAHLVAGNPERAVELLVRVVDEAVFAPATLRFRLSKAMVAASDYQGAYRQIRYATASSPAYFDAHLLSGEILHQLQRYDDALASYTEALRLRPGHFETRVRLALLMLDTGDYEKALVYVDEAIEIYGGEAFSHYVRALILKAMDRTEEAILSANLAYRIDRGMTDAQRLYEELIEADSDEE